MSQPNRPYPIFNVVDFDGTGHTSHPPHLNNAYFPQQWIPSGSRTAINSMPSPTDTVSTGWTAPMSRAATQTSFQQPRRNTQRQNNIDPRLQNHHLVPPGPHSFSTAQGNADQINPLLRFYQDDEPWNPHQLRSSSININLSHFDQRERSFRDYRQKPCSVDSNALVSDSGYDTLPTHSVFSNDPIRFNEEFPTDVIQQTRALNVDSVPHEGQDMQRIPSDQISVSRYSNRSGNQKQQLACSEAGCSVVSKCPSDQKRHMLKHQKNFVCEESGCKRGGKGFATINDLDRHRKSVHKIGLMKTKSYMCAADSCKSKSKMWPRLDNFKQHIERMHKEENELDLILRSECHPPASPPTTQSLPVDQAHLLAGMVPEATVAIEDSIDGTLSMGAHSFSHPQFVSFTGRSTSDASQVSPSTNTLDVQVPQMGVPSSNRSDIDTPNTNPCFQTMDNTSTPAAGCRKSSNISPTDADANQTSAEKSNHDHNAMAQLHVTNAPQTKSEQQQHQVLQSLSRTNINIEEIVLSVLSAEQQESSSHEIPSLTLSDAKKMQVSRAIADMVKQKTKPVRSQQRRSPQISTSSMQPCWFENCNFSGRTCDLNKHMKRHQKPYGCTYPKCHKRFGAKSDWKRHENSQHFQLEAYRCDYPNNAGQKCGQHCYRTALFQKHLADKHKTMSEQKMHADLKRCKIGKNCQVQFWCGFCREIKTLKNKRNAAWDERFDHIAEHFEKKKDSIDDWLCVEENRTKRQLQVEVDRTAFPDEENGDMESDESGGDGAVSTTRVETATIPRPQAPSQKRPHKRPVPTDPREETRPSKKRARAIYWYCCQCGDGLLSLTVQVSCLCEHAACSSCKYFDDPTK